MVRGGEEGYAGDVVVVQAADAVVGEEGAAGEARGGRVRKEGGNREVAVVENHQVCARTRNYILLLNIHVALRHEVRDDHVDEGKALLSIERNGKYVLVFSNAEQHVHQNTRQVVVHYVLRCLDGGRRV